MSRMIWPIGCNSRRMSGWPASNFCAASSTLMEKLDANFADFLRSLNRHEVKYLVVGGYAVGYHGFVRATGDLDVFVGISEANAGKLVAAFRDFGFDVPELSRGVFMERGKIVRIGVPPLRLEVMNDISGVSFPECYARRIEEMIDGVRINFIDREKLLVNKRAAGRPKDLADVDALIRRTGEGRGARR
jgi:predicted nucleotidyltransferase